MKRAKAPLSFVVLLLSLGIAGPTTAFGTDLPRPSQAKAPEPPQKVRLVQSYGRARLSFEANQGQTDSRVRFLARGGGYTIFLTADEAVLALRKSQPDRSRFGKFGLPGRLDPFGPLDPRAGRWPSLADDLKSLWRSLIPDLGQLVPEPNAGKGGVAALESQSPQVVRMRLVGGNAEARVVGLDELPGKSNYFIGNDPKKWRTNVLSYARVKYEDVYPGVDLVYYGNQRQLEYDFVVAPGADPSAIVLDVGAVREPPQRAHRDAPLQIATNGDLIVSTDGGQVIFHKPVVYQPGVASPLRTPNPEPQTPLNGQYVLMAGNQVGFEVSKYDRTRPLIIDPVLSYSTYLGGFNGDGGGGIAVDAAGNAYVAGTTGSYDFPTANPLQSTLKGGYNAFVAKLDPTGSALVYSTYLGGSVEDGADGIAVDVAGNAYVTGVTESADFPTVNAVQPACHLDLVGNCFNDAFVAKLNPTGSALVYSTFLGGSDQDGGYSIAVDKAGSAYVAGWTYSADFPASNPCLLQPSGSCWDGFVVKLSPAGSALVYSLYVGGYAYGIAADAAGSAYITGPTWLTDFPTVNPLQGTCHGCTNGYADAFVAKLNPTGSAFVYSTYLGGSGNQYGTSIAVDGKGNAYVTGWTTSTDFPTANPLQPRFGGGGGGSGFPYWGDAFVAKLNRAGNALVYSTYLGGSSSELGAGIAVDSLGSAYVTGWTESKDFPTANPLQGCNRCGTQEPDTFVAKLNPAGSPLAFSTYLGGSGPDKALSIAVDSSGNAYVTGWTESTDFPTANALQLSGNAYYGGDAFVAKIETGCKAYGLLDTDCDGIPDDWEINGYRDEATGRFVDLPAMGANPLHKDLFVQTDYMVDPPVCLPAAGCSGGHSHQPKQFAMLTVAAAFSTAPVENPDGSTGINLHIDCGPNCVMNPVTGDLWETRSEAHSLTHQNCLGWATPDGSSYNWTAFNAIKSKHFSAARAKVFHYAVFAHDYGDLPLGSPGGPCGSPPNGPNSSSGISNGIPGQDFIVSLGEWTDSVGSVFEQAGTFMHEFGHNLNLHHGGRDDIVWKPNYLSIMNYLFQSRGLVRDGYAEGLFDYSQFIKPALNENHLNETTGINVGGSPISSYGTRYYCGAGNEQLSMFASPIDWNCSKDGGSEADVAANIAVGPGYLGNPKLMTLSTSNDWINLIFDLSRSAAGKGQQGVPQELTRTIDARILTVHGVAVSGTKTVPLRPGSGQLVTVNITNTGTQPDTYMLEPGWEVGWVDWKGVPNMLELAPGQSKSVKFGVNVPSWASIGQFGQVALTAQSWTNPLVKDTAEIKVLAALADMAITMSGSLQAPPVGPNGEITYSIDVSNEGPGDADGVTVADSEPYGARFVSADSTVGTCAEETTLKGSLILAHLGNHQKGIRSGSQVTCDLGNLAAGAHAHITVVVAVRTSATVTNTASVASGVPDSNFNNNSATVTITNRLR